jgi:DNA replication and repair protein RecF
MFISHIEYWNFRNLSDDRIELSPEMNLIVGLNGQGKTSLLEAVYVSCFSKSFRTSQLTECITHGAEAFRVGCRIPRHPLPVDLEVRLTPGGKELRMNEKKASISDFLEGVSVLCITADHLRIITDGPEYRRRFFDGLMALFEPDSLAALASYRRALRQKNTLLKQDRVPVSTLESWNRKLIQEAKTVVRRRREFLNSLAGFLKTDRFSRAPISVEYEPSLDERQLDDEDELLDMLQKSLPREQVLGRSLFGPHLDQYHFRMAGKNVRRYCSTGQKRSMLLNIYLAMLQLFVREKGDWPVLMIDDVDLELDLQRIRKLLELLDVRTQIFLSSSKAEIFEDLIGGHAHFRIHEGQVYK